jgi:sulfate permease, SulP family
MTTSNAAATPGPAGDSQKKGRHFPVQVLQGILPIDRKRLPLEIVAGITLACLAIPETMGYTKIAGMPVITGLYTIVLPLGLFAILGSSRHLVVGADSASAAIMFAGLAGMAAVASPQYVALAGMLALMTGGILILARILRLGFIADFLSRTVLIGFLTGVGIQVACGQFSGLFGIPKTGSGPVSQVINTFKDMGSASWTTFIVSICVAVLIVGGPFLSKRIPWALIAVIGAIIASYVWDLAAHGVGTLGAVPSGLPGFSWPSVSLSQAGQLVATAFSIFIVILAQSAATSRAYAAKFGDKNFDENTDLVGLGLANIGAGFTGTFVVNGSPTKTQMVNDAGGHSQLASLVTVVIVAVVLLFLTKPLSYMPNAVLATVVFIIGVRLVDVRGMTLIARRRIWEFGVALVTAAVVVFVGVEEGIIAAIILSLLIHLRHSYRPVDRLITTTPHGVWKGVKLGQLTEMRPGLMIYRFGAEMYYANSNQFETEMRYLAAQAAGLRWLCIQSEAIEDMDFTASAALREIVQELAGKGITIVLCEVEPQVRRELDRDGLTKVIGEDHIFESSHEVIQAFEKLPASQDTGRQPGGATT